MKKILLASTALVVSAGFAAAEVVIGGDGYMGVAYGAYDGDGIFDTTDTSADTRTFTRADGTTFTRNVSSYSFIYDLDVDFSVSMQSDSGLTFGASGDFDDLGASQGARGWDNSIFVSGDFGTITMGDTNGGAEQVIGDLAGVGLSGLGDLNETAFLVTAGAQPAGPVARYDYSVSGITLSLGLTDDAGYSIGAGYATDLFSVGLAYEAVMEGATITLLDPSSTFIRTSDGASNALTTTAGEDTTHLIGAASVTFSGVTLKGIYGRADQDNVGSVDQYGVSAAAGFGAASVTAYWRQLETDPDVGASVTTSFYGLGAAYDLGGGLALEAGVAQYDIDEVSAASGNTVVADFGVSINF
ncbi:porin [Meridianimarinicoccus sp. RP-17]|uniref:porin n=1 Tax=Meridianimarinicoccus zhengii TaxID=2056810 RepID=UPI0013A6C819|nr:porin [Phycocomes zhengii]